MVPGSVVPACNLSGSPEVTPEALAGIDPGKITPLTAPVVKKVQAAIGRLK